MNFSDEKDDDKSGRREGEADPRPTSGKARKKRAPVPEVGNALRSVYQRAVEEDIPPEMLDLLGKLG